MLRHQYRVGLLTRFLLQLMSSESRPSRIRLQLRYSRRFLLLTHLHVSHQFMFKHRLQHHRLIKSLTGLSPRGFLLSK